MFRFFKDGIQRIKDTRKYAKERNVSTNWPMMVLSATTLIFVCTALITLAGILYFFGGNSKLNVPDFMINTVQYYPFIATALIMIRFGYIPIKLFIWFEMLFQKLIMKLINKLDMILWKKTGKDSVVSNFMVKHKTIVRLIFYAPLIISLILRILNLKL